MDDHHANHMAIHSSHHNSHSSDHSDGMYHLAQLAATQAKTAGATFVLRSTGQDAQFGLVCCPNDSILCSQPPFLPAELNGIMSIEEYNDLCGKLNKIFKDTVMPMMPCICCHFCIPFSPICAMMYYKSERLNGAKTVINDFNQRVLQPRGAYLEVMMEFDYIAQLRVNPTARQQYLASCGIQSVPVPMQQTAGYLPQYAQAGYAPQYAAAPQPIPVPVGSYAPQFAALDPKGPYVSPPQGYYPVPAAGAYPVNAVVPVGPQYANNGAYTAIPQSATINRGFDKTNDGNGVEMASATAIAV